MSSIRMLNDIIDMRKIQQDFSKLKPLSQVDVAV